MSNLPNDLRTTLTNMVSAIQGLQEGMDMFERRINRLDKVVDVDNTLSDILGIFNREIKNTDDMIKGIDTHLEETVKALLHKELTKLNIVTPDYKERTTPPPEHMYAGKKSRAKKTHNKKKVRGGKKCKTKRLIRIF